MSSSTPKKLRIGITGHRSIRDPEKIKLKIELAIRNILTDQNSFIAYTSLAYGADTLFAQVARERFNAEIQTVIPFKKEEYEKDFDTSERKMEFNHWCNTTSLVELQDVPSVISKEWRNEAYFQCGKYIVDQCDYIITVWDGKPSAGWGGTGDIIDYARSKKKHIIIIPANKFKQTNPVNSDQSVVGEIKKLEYFYKHKPNNSFYEKQINYLRQIYFESLPPMEKDRKDDRRELFEKYFLPLFVKTESVSQKFKNLYSSTGLSVYLLSLLALLVLLVAYIFSANMLLAYIAEAVILFIILGLIVRANHLHSHQNWLDARALSEKLRVLGFFLLTDVPLKYFKQIENKRAVKNNNWTIKVLEELLKTFPPLHLPHINTKPGQKYSLSSLLEFVKSGWIDDQLNYHKSFCRKKEKWNNFFEKGSLLLFIAAILVALTHIFFIAYMHDVIPGIIEKLMLLLSLSFPVIAATMEGIRKHREYSRNIRRSKQMIVDLTELQKEAENIKSMAEFNAFMFRTANIMINENESWFQWMEDAKLEVHA